MSSSSASPATPAVSTAPTIKVTVRRVVVDVVVMDSAGKPVKGLTRDDLRITEDGKPQQIRSFEAYTATPQPPVEAPKLPPDTFSNFSGGPQSGPVTVILYDLLNTPLDAQPYAHAQLLDFLKKHSGKGQVAIFVLTDRLHMLQGFTDDDNALIDALNSQKGFKSSQLQTGTEASTSSTQLAETNGGQTQSGGQGGAGQGGAQLPNGANNAPAAASDVSVQTVTAMLQHMETMESSALLDRRVEITAGALEEISSFLAGMQGRKNLLWMSGSFPAGVLPNADSSGRDAFDVSRNYTQDMKQATDALNQSHTAVYPVDVRGLQVNPMFSAAGNPTFQPGSGGDLQAVRNFSQAQSAEHSTMDTIGDETGGRAFYNTNGLSEAASMAVEDGSTYYTLSYSPTNRKEDGGLRQVRVECLKPGYHLSYRRNYFAAGGDTKEAANAAPADDDANDPMEVPLRHGAPPARQLFFVAHVQAEGAPTEASAKELAVLSQYQVEHANKKHPQTLVPRGPVQMQHYLVTYGLLARQLELTAGEDGVRHGDLEFAVMAFDADGNVLDGIRTKVQEAIKPERYEEITKQGYQLIQRIDIPVKAAFLRVGVRDVSDNQMGSMELHLPLDSKNLSCGVGDASSVAVFANSISKRTQEPLDEYAMNAQYFFPANITERRYARMNRFRLSG